MAGNGGRPKESISEGMFVGSENIVKGLFHILEFNTKKRKVKFVQ